jgi:hypothetical protein
VLVVADQVIAGDSNCTTLRNDWGASAVVEVAGLFLKANGDRNTVQASGWRRHPGRSEGWRKGRIRGTIHGMTGPSASRLEGTYSRFGDDLPSFASEVLRRFQTDGFVGFSLKSGEITVIPFAAVKRLDFAQLPR